MAQLRARRETLSASATRPARKSLPTESDVKIATMPNGVKPKKVAKIESARKRLGPTAAHCWPTGEGGVER